MTSALRYAQENQAVGTHNFGWMAAAALGKGDEAVLTALDVDFRTVRPKYVRPQMKTYPDGSCDTIWGVRRAGLFYGQTLNHPLASAESVNEVEEYAWPSPDEWDMQGPKEQAKRHAGEYAVMGGVWSPFFHDVAELFDMENMFLKMVESPAIVQAAIGKAMEFYLELSRRMFEEMADSLDIFFFGNDYGSQTGLLCSPEMWRRFLAPSTKAKIDMGHKYGPKTAPHSCGSIMYQGDCYTSSMRTRLCSLSDRRTAVAMAINSTSSS